MDVLEHRKNKITGAIMANSLADRFKRGDESVMEMMKRIKGEITTDATTDQWENKLEEFGVVFRSWAMNQAEKELRQQQFDGFKANYEYYDLTPSKEKIQAFERYVSGEIDAEQLQKNFP